MVKSYLAARMAFLLSAVAGRLKRSALFWSLCSTKDLKKIRTQAAGGGVGTADEYLQKV